MESADSGERRDCVTVVVLGDLGRSPRMCRHSQALAESGYRVEVIAYVEGEVPDELARHERVRIRAIRAPAEPKGRGVGYLVASVPRLLGQLVAFCAVLARSRRAVAIIVQNPPAVHVLPILLLCRRLRGTRLIVDWHNFGWTILGLRLGQDSILVSVAGWFERSLASRADGHLCVSRAMADWLRESASLEATPVYDVPAEPFVAVSRLDRGDVRQRILPRLGLPQEVVANLIGDRAALVVSSSSWTADEDFSLLLEALRRWSTTGVDADRPHLVVVVSGRGRLREQFERDLCAEPIPGVTVGTVWLSEPDYPQLLAAADLGVCLHRSASGVDLPMKLADMLGVGLPVCVLDYGPCLREVVTDGENAFLFRDAPELVATWRRLLVDEPALRAATRAHLVSGQRDSWLHHWGERVRPLLDSMEKC